MDETLEAAVIPSWLELLQGSAPILLIAPHGGRAGVAARATLHPKVNDLETAAITRELAQRLDATALVNHGMDRNDLDCNRLSQIARREPWILDTIADEVDKITARHGRAIVLLIHGWNIIEPRVDLGLGLREKNGRMTPVRGAHISADDDFIQQTTHALATRLRKAGIEPTYGLRYPGGDAQNLLQAFTPRHAASDYPAVRKLATLANAGSINALQLELSVAVRLPGATRENMIDAVVETFGPARGELTSRSQIAIVRDETPKPVRKVATSVPNLPPFRIGVEFYDPEIRIGGMASFDFGPNAAGGRIMMLSERRRVALFTGEGGAVRRGDSVSLGPLTLDGTAGNSGLRFRGPAVVVDDGAAYLSVEGALAGGRLDPAMEIETALDFAEGAPRFGDVLTRLESLIAHLAENGDGPRDVASIVAPSSSFGQLRGAISFDGARYPLSAIARVGVSFTGLGPSKFTRRRMLWACVQNGPGHEALELRSFEFDDVSPRSSVELLTDGAWRPAELTALDLEAADLTPPDIIIASIRQPPRTIGLEGVPGTFMTLSRPGPDGTRIHTSLGFARYRIDGREAAGMYEYSRRADATSPGEIDNSED
jgi:hypothetical protein